MFVYRKYLKHILAGSVCTTAALLMGFVGSAQRLAPRYVITANIKAQEGTRFFLSYLYGGKAFKDSTIYQNGQVVFRGQLPEPLICTLSNSQNQQLRIFIAENTQLSFSGSMNQLFDLKLKGGIQDSLYRIYNAGYGQISQEFRKDLEKSGAGRKDHASPAYLRYRERVDSLLNSFVHTYASSTAAALAIIDSYVTNPDRKAAAKAYTWLSNKGKQGFYAKRIQQFSSADVRLSVGNTVPDFNLPDLQGKKHHLSDFRGKYVFLDFWASWCPPCRAEHPMLRALHKKYGDDQIQFLSVSMDSSDPAWRKAVADDQLTWLQLGDPQALSGPLADIYGIKSLPASFLLDKNGKIIASHLRGEALAEKIRTLLGS